MKRYILIIMLMTLMAMLNAVIDLKFDVETGIAIPGYNDAKIPNEDSSYSFAPDEFSLKDELNLKSALHTRLNIHWRPHPKHQISLMATPLTLKGKGEFDRNIDYMGTRFHAGDPVEVSYRFDSYRLQYRYLFRKPVLGFIRSVGAAGKIRDAEIGLESASAKATKTNTGFVPLLNFNLGYSYSPDLDFVMEAEGLGSPYGRAEDVFVGAVYNLKDRLDVKAGYRILEGGSDAGEVYTFAAVHYAVLGFVVGF